MASASSSSLLLGMAAVLPLRTTECPPGHLVELFADYFERYNHNTTTQQYYNVEACIPDLKRIENLRRQCAQITLQSQPNQQQPQEQPWKEVYHEYYQLLLECETQHHITTTNGAGAVLPHGGFVWQCPQTQQTLEASTLWQERSHWIWNMACFQMQDAWNLHPHDKASWTLAAQEYSTAASWLGQLSSNTMGQHDGEVIISPKFVKVWQALLKAQSQFCVYESLRVSSLARPRHLLLAKLAAAAVTLFAQVGRIDESDITSLSVPRQWIDVAQIFRMYLSSCAEYHQAMVSLEKKSTTHYSQPLGRLQVAHSMIQLALEYCEEKNHQNQNYNTMDEDNNTQPPRTSLDECSHVVLWPHSQQVADALQQAHELHETSHHSHDPIPEPQELPEIRGQMMVPTTDPPLSQLLVVASNKPAGPPLFEHAMSTHGGAPRPSQARPSTSAHPNPLPPTPAAHHQEIVFDPNENTYNANERYAAQDDDLGEDHAPIPLQIITTTSQDDNDDDHDDDEDDSLNDLDDDLYQQEQEARDYVHQQIAQQQAHEAQCLAELQQSMRQYLARFHSEMQVVIHNTRRLADERTQAAQTTLSTVHLPHSLTAYEQSQKGGGLPLPLWDKIHRIQTTNQIPKLKQALWQLKDASEVAHACLRRVQRQLQDDLEADRLFHENHSHFQGHNVAQIQRPFVQGLANYQSLLETAHEGDSVLLQRLQQLDTNPKYKLLQFSKSQLDRLLPAATSDNRFDTFRLSRRLVELSTLLKNRQLLVDQLQADYEGLDVRGIFEEEQPTTPQEWERALKVAKSALDGILHALEANLEAQPSILDSILAENEAFLEFRRNESSRYAGGTSSASGDSCLAMIEDAMDDMEEVSQHLEEGKGFYDVIVPKLEKLQQEVGDISARLTVERLEYDDHANRHRQEEEDAAMAQRLYSSSGQNQETAAAAAAAAAASFETPGTFPAAAAGPPPFQVDDEKLATLVGMEFDPAKVVEALTRHDNNVDQALNDLLSE